MKTAFAGILAALTFSGVALGETALIYQKGRKVSASTPRLAVCAEIQAHQAIVRAELADDGGSIEIAPDLILFRAIKGESVDFQKLKRTYPGLAKQLDDLQNRWALSKAASSEMVFPEKSRGVAATIATLDQKVFKGEMKLKNDYLLTIWEEFGVRSVPLASLTESDFQKFNEKDRSRDARFWFERACAVTNAQQHGHEVLKEAEQVARHLDLVNEWCDRLNAESAALAAAKSRKIDAERKAKARNRAEIESLLSLIEMGYNPYYDSATGKIYISEAEARIARKRFLESAVGGGR